MDVDFVCVGQTRLWIGAAFTGEVKMLAITHAAIAAAGVSLLFSTADPLVLSLAVLGSQLPDLDTTTSVIGQVLYSVSRWIEDRFPHRSITHSLVATAAIAFYKAVNVNSGVSLIL